MPRKDGGVVAGAAAGTDAIVAAILVGLDDLSQPGLGVSGAGRGRQRLEAAVAVVGD